jgi:hypothetical protein
MTGTVLSVTVRFTVQVVLLFAASFAVITTGVTPRPAKDPATGNWVMVIEPDGVQLSVTESPVLKSGITA